MMQTKQKKTILLSSILLITITISLLGLTYAYYKTRIIGNEKEESVTADLGKLEVKYIDGAEVAVEKFDLGDTIEKTFSVENTGDGEANYGIKLENLTNTFERARDLTFTLKKNDEVIKTGTVPKIKTSYILDNVNIDLGATDEYTLIIKYIDLIDIDQSEDMGKELSFKINIGEGVRENLFYNSEEGTLLAALEKNNVVVEPLSIPGRENPLTKYVDMGMNPEVKTANLTAAQMGLYFHNTKTYTFDEEKGLYFFDECKGTYYNNSWSSTNYKDLINSYVGELYGSGTANSHSNCLYNGTNTVYYFIDANTNTKNTITYTQTNPVFLKSIEHELNSKEDDYGTSYYFRGGVENNYVNFGEMCWRIVRIQGDGTIKLTLADENNLCNSENYSKDNGTSAFIENGVLIPFQLEPKNSETDLLLSDSYVLEKLNEWKEKKQLNEKLLVETEWCSDLSRTGSKGNTVYYGAYDRLSTEDTAFPSLKCDFVGQKGGNANKTLSNIGLLTADEMALAGGTITYDSKTKYYLQDNTSGATYYWSMSPSDISTSSNKTYIYLMGSHGQLYSTNNYVNSSFAVRPVVALKSDVRIAKGDGTQQNPYEIAP